MLDAVFIAESVDQANWQALQKLGQKLPDGQLKHSFTAAVERSPVPRKRAPGLGAQHPNQADDA